MADKLKLPKFANEAEEAQWWFDHSDEVTKEFEGAAAHGQLTTGLAAGLARKDTGSSVTLDTAILLDPEDISRARALAAKRGLRCQTYLEMLVREALDAEEQVK